MFAALGTVCDYILTPGFSAGIWFSSIFLLSSITGMVLGPYNGFISTFISVMIGHTLAPRGVYEYIFTLGAPVGSLISGFMFRGHWRKVLVFYTIMLALYFLTPISWLLPLWGMWDVYAAYAIVVALSIVMSVRGRGEIRHLSPFAVSAFVGLEADVLFRIFILIPGQTYELFYGLTVEMVIDMWAVAAPLVTPFKVLLATFVATMIAPQIIRVLEGTKN